MTYERVLLVKPKGRSGLGFALDLLKGQCADCKYRFTRGGCRVQERTAISAVILHLIPIAFQARIDESITETKRSMHNAPRTEESQCLHTGL